MTNANKLKAIFVSAITAGILDISGAIIVYAFVLKITTPMRILQSVAAGVFGKESYTGGIQTVLAGLILHFLIALIFAIFYALIYPFFNKLVNSTPLKGFLYGCFVWAVMNYIVLPISNTVKPAVAAPFNLQYFLIAIGLMILCVGLPVAYITAAFNKKS